eukprot:318367-Prymnesium_polylepis.1
MTGVPPRDIVSEVDANGVSRAFVDSFSAPGGGAGALRMGEFKECLLRLADARYAGVAELDRPGRLRGLLATLLDGVSVADVIQKAGTPQLAPRRPTREPDAQIAAQWHACWGAVALDGLYGYPLWEAEVHDLLLAAYAPLCSIFLAYAVIATPGGAKDSAADPEERTH